MGTVINNVNSNSECLNICKCNTCPNIPLLVNSWNPFNPILGGVDVVSYFTINTNTPQTIYTNYQPLMGTDAFQSTYMGYTYYFNNQDNLNLFNANPSKYIPQFGGYCAKSIALEYFLPNETFKQLQKKIPNLANGYPWNSNCLGATSSRNCWMIINGKLFLFYRNESRNFFMSNLVQNYNIASYRWNTFIQIWKKNNVDPAIIMSTASFPTQSGVKSSIY